MYAIKDKKLVLSGTRNYRDRLWDVPLPYEYPVEKTTIQEGNYTTTNNNAGLYNKQFSGITFASTPVIVPPPPPYEKYNFEFQGMNDLIDDNRDYQTINHQLRLDRQQTMTGNPQQANIIIKKQQTKTDLVKFLHAACFAPVKSTFTKAVKNNHFVSWPGLDPALISKHLEVNESTIKGHMNRESSNLQSTKKSSITKGLDDIALKELKDDYFPMSNTQNKKTNEVAYQLLQRSSQEGKAFMDLTGKYPIKSTSGNQYVLVAYNYDSNAILAEPIPNRQARSITNAYEIMQQTFAKAGVAPHTWVLDNEKSEILEEAFTKYKVNFQLVPPFTHRANLAERAIQTFKAHFKTGLDLAHPNFPKTQWDRLIPQAVMTLNMLRSARINPKISAYASIFGEFNFNATPLLPPGTQIVAHRTPEDRATWDINGEIGWYVGPSLHHYRCVKCYFPKTRRVKDIQKLEILPHNIPIPEVNMNDFLHQATGDILAILQTPPSTTALSLEAGDPTRNALEKIATILQRKVTIPRPTTTDDLAPTQPTETTAPTRVRRTKTPTKVSFNLDRNRIYSTQPIQRTTTATAANITVRDGVRLPRVKINNSKLNFHQKNEYNLPLAVKEKFDNAIKHLTDKYLPIPTPPTRLRSSNTNKTFKHRATLLLTATEIFRASANHIYDKNGRKETVDTLIHGENKRIWIQALSNELGRLLQGNDAGVKSTDCMEFISKHEIPEGRKVTYANFVCDHRPLKTEPFRIRLVVGGDRLEYADDTGSPAASMLETKMLVNSVISNADEGARFMSCDLKDFFLASTMTRPEYMRIPWKYIPYDIRTRYNLHLKKHNDNVYVKIKRGMYGFKQAAILAYEQLVDHLKQFEYEPVLGTTCIFRHRTRRTVFCLCVDDFGVKYFSQDDLQHFLQALEAKYTVTTDMQGKHFCGLTFDWHYSDGYVDMAMPGYVTQALTRLQHKPTKNHNIHHTNM